jgi:hypothetical protein
MSILLNRFGEGSALTEMPPELPACADPPGALSEENFRLCWLFWFPISSCQMENSSFFLFFLLFNLKLLI